MTVLAIDYGKRKLGLALGEGHLATPHSTLRISSWQDALKKIAKVVELEKVGKVVVGVSEGRMAEEQKMFAKTLEKIGLPVETWDETLTTKEAQVLAREAGIRPKRRRKLEDAYAAAIMLQSYLEAHDSKKSTESV